ncbi:MAG: hypothetical protein ACHQ1E_08605 [Ktedonobacterales bacterium]|jgi:hypothetical protein
MIERQWSNLVVALLGACAIACMLGFLTLRLTGPSDGTWLEPDAPVWSSAGIAVTPLGAGSTGGLRRGDVVVAVAGHSMQEWARLLADPAAARPRWRPGEVVMYNVLRGGRETNVPVRIMPYSAWGALGENWGSLVFALAFALIGAFVFLRRPADRAARALFLAGCCLLSAQPWSFGLQISDLIFPAGFWLFQLTAFGAYTIFWAALLHFALIFPRPHPLVARVRWLAPSVYAAAGAYLMVFLIATRVTSGDMLTWLGTWTPGQGIVGIFYFAAAILIALDTFRRNRNDPVTSRKIRWIVFAGALSGGAGLLLSILPGDVFGQAIINTNALGLTLLPIPIAFAFAILRYRLFDIDVIINRALVYGALTGSLALVYWVSVLALQTLSGRLSGLTVDWPPAIVASTLLIAALFRPLRARLQSLIDRRFYRHKYDAARELEAFGASLREQTELEDLSHRVVAVIEKTMQPSSISLWLASPHHAQSGS